MPGIKEAQIAQGVVKVVSAVTAAAWLILISQIRTFRLIRPFRRRPAGTDDDVEVDLV